MTLAEQVLHAMGDAGPDLVDMVEHCRFPKSLLRRVLPAAACAALLLGAGLGVLRNQPAAPEVTETVEETQAAQLLPLEEADIWCPARETYDCFRLNSDYTVDSPYVVVDSQGRIILETDQGWTGLLTDQATGEYLAIFHHLDSVLTIYDLQGRKLQELEAAYLECFGDLVIVYENGGPGEADEPEWLYRRSDGQLLYEGIYNTGMIGDYVYVVPQSYEETRFMIYDAQGQLRLRGSGTQEINDSCWTDGTLYLGINDFKVGDVCIADQDGQAVTDQTYPYNAQWFNGYVWWSENGEQRILDLRTGQEVFSIQENDPDGGLVSIVSVYEDLVVLSVRSGLTKRVQVVDWSGQPVVPEAVSVQVIDDEDDGVPELLACGRDGGGFYEMSYYTPDGELVRTMAVTGSVDTVSSRTVLQVRPGEGIALVHLESGETLDQFAKPYTDAVSLWPLRSGIQASTGLFYAVYRDEDGRERVDLLREDGSLVLENIADFDRDTAWQGSGSYEGNGVFRVEGGFRHLDGTWLYRVAE